LLGEERHVETDADLVTLPEIVTFVLVVIDDELFAQVTLILGHRHVVEGTIVPGVGKNVVAVSSLESLGSNLRCLEIFEALVAQHGELNRSLGTAHVLPVKVVEESEVALLFVAPLAVVVVEGVPVGVDVLVEGDVADLEAGEASGKLLIHHVSEEVLDDEDDGEEEEGPGGSFPSLRAEYVSGAVAGKGSIGFSLDGGQVLVGQERSGTEEPVSEKHHEDRRGSHLINDVLAERHIVHGWEPVRVEEHGFLGDPEDEHS